MSSKINKDDNFLDLIPVRTGSQDWETDENGMVQIIIPRDKVLDKMVRVFFKTPKTMTISLDAHGSAVWTAIDGQNTVYDIGSILEERFGDDAQPLYERLSKYINILRNNKFISLKKDGE